MVAVTNLFSLADRVTDIWSACLAAAARMAPGRPVVGYESGAALADAREHGFDSIGALRVWIAAGATWNLWPAHVDRTIAPRQRVG